MWAAKIAADLKIPNDFGLGDFPDEWTKPSSHTGPKESSPLKSALIDKTQSSLYAILSGTLIWAAKRLQYMTDTRPLMELAEALFCFQHDPDYLAPRKVPRPLEFERQEKYQATVAYFEYAFFNELWWNQKDWPLFPNFYMTAEAIMLTRHHMSPVQRKSFDAWVEGIIRQMDLLARLPEHASFTWDISDEEMPAQRLITMGQPIPPQALRLVENLASFDASQASAEFLRTVDWAHNRYLKRPNDISLRFAGRPYEDPR